MKLNGNVIFPNARNFAEVNKNDDDFECTQGDVERERSAMNRQCIERYDAICIKSDLNVFGR